MRNNRRAGQDAFVPRGYTLIELLLYISILGSLLTAISLYFSTTTESRVKNQSITEVNQQGALITERIAQTIRNADTITSPTAGNSAASLTLAMANAGINPTIFDMDAQVMGYNGTGTATDGSDSNTANATKFTAPASGNITTLYARVASPISSSPNNKGQMAIYSGTTNPAVLLASSSDVTLTGDAWNVFPIASVSVTSGQTYWLAYNTNGALAADNNLRRRVGTTNQSQWISRTYGTWPASFNANSQDLEFSMYADIGAGGGGTTIRVKEGAGSFIPLNNSKVQVSGLTFTNLSRGSTPGVMRFSFTVSRVNASGKNGYDYQKTFTGSAALR